MALAALQQYRLSSIRDALINRTYDIPRLLTSFSKCPLKYSWGNGKKLTLYACDKKVWSLCFLYWETCFFFFSCSLQVQCACDCDIKPVSALSINCKVPKATLQKDPPGWIVLFLKLAKAYPPPLGRCVFWKQGVSASNKRTNEGKKTLSFVSILCCLNIHDDAVFRWGWW